MASNEFAPMPGWTGTTTPQTMTTVAGKYTQAMIAIGEGRPEESLEIGRSAVRLQESLLGVPAESRLSDAWLQTFAALAGDLGAASSIVDREEPLTPVEQAALAADLRMYGRSLQIAVDVLGAAVDVKL